MIASLLEIAGILGISAARHSASKQALNVLIKRGVLGAGTTLRTKGVSSLLKNMQKRGWDSAKAVRDIYKRQGRTFVQGRGSVSRVDGFHTTVPGGTAILPGRAVRHGFGSGTLGQAVSQGQLGVGAARDVAFGAFAEAGTALQTGRAFGAAEKIVMGSMTFGAGFSMFSGADRYFEKNIPTPMQELMQTQQMFLPRQAHTQRQRAIQAIHQSGMTTRAALGNEASYLHS